MNTNPNAKRILCYGDSNTWGWVPGKMGKERFDVDVRWPGVLQKFLGENFEVIEEALGARTISTDDPRPELPLRNGFQTLPIILESHLPIDFVIIMLGTTETKEIMNLSPEEIGLKMKNLIQFVQAFKTLENTNPPGIILIAPPIVDETAEFASTLFKGATQKCKDLVKVFKSLTEELGIRFFDASIAEVGEDGVHITKEGHKKIAQGVIDLIININLIKE